MAGTVSARPSADVKNTGREVQKQVGGRDLPVIVSHVVSPDEIYVQHASSVAQESLQRFYRFVCVV